MQTTTTHFKVNFLESSRTLQLCGGEGVGISLSLSFAGKNVALAVAVGQIVALRACASLYARNVMPQKTRDDGGGGEDNKRHLHRAKIPSHRVS